MCRQHKSRISAFIPDSFSRLWLNFKGFSLLFSLGFRKNRPENLDEIELHKSGDWDLPLDNDNRVVHIENIRPSYSTALALSQGHRNTSTNKGNNDNDKM